LGLGHKLGESRTIQRDNKKYTIGYLQADGVESPTQKLSAIRQTAKPSCKKPLYIFLQNIL